jgi:hypothetical protein
MESLSDPQELRRCIRDLVALSTLPAIWTSYGPQQIADSVAAALVSMLSADFVYVVLPEERGQSLIEVIHPGKGIASDSLRAVRDTLRRDLTRRPEQTAVIDNPAGPGKLRLTTAPISFGGDAVSDCRLGEPVRFSLRGSAASSEHCGKRCDNRITALAG